jgi:hypothetical protein
MTPPPPAAAPLLPILAAALPAAAQTAYRWVDKDGRVQYSDQPPPQEIKKFEERRLQPNRGNAQLPLRHPQGRRNLPGHPLPAGMRQALRRRRALLTKRGVPFSETKLESADDVAAFKNR